MTTETTTPVPLQRDTSRPGGAAVGATTPSPPAGRAADAGSAGPGKEGRGATGRARSSRRLRLLVAAAGVAFLGLVITLVLGRGDADAVGDATASVPVAPASGSVTSSTATDAATPGLLQDVDVVRNPFSAAGPQPQPTTTPAAATTSAATTPVPAATVTVPASTVTVPGPRTTVSVPGPTVTVRVPGPTTTVPGPTTTAAPHLAVRWLGPTADDRQRFTVDDGTGSAAVVAGAGEALGAEGPAALVVVDRAATTEGSAAVLLRTGTTVVPLPLGETTTIY